MGTFHIELMGTFHIELMGTFHIELMGTFHYSCKIRGWFDKKWQYHKFHQNQPFLDLELLLLRHFARIHLDWRLRVAAIQRIPVRPGMIIILGSARL